MKRMFIKTETIGLLMLVVLALPFAAWSSSHQNLTENNRYDVQAIVDGHPTYGYIVKFSILLDNKGEPKTVWFQDSNLKFHSDFLTKLPEFKGLTRTQIDALALRQNGRQIFIGSILETRYSLDNEKPEHHLEILSEDPIPGPLIRKLSDFVLSRTQGIIQNFYYAPSPEQRSYVDMNREAFVAAGVKLAQISGSSTESVCYSSGWAIGPVKIVRAQEFSQAWSQGLISSADILVMDEVPRELPPFAALIVSSPTSPSSHPALLAEMSQSPFLFQKKAIELEKWKSLAQTGEVIILNVEGGVGQGLCNQFIQSASRLSANEVNQLMALKKPQPLEIRDWIDKGILPQPLTSIGIKDSLVFGAKAAHVAELARWIPGNTVSQGLAIPIALFARALKEGKVGSESLEAYVNQRIKVARTGTSMQTQVALQEVRNAFQTATFPKEFFEPTIRAIEKMFPAKTRIKLRSSSNAEDSKNFNGAGLYDSLGACLGDDKVDNNQTLCSPSSNPRPPKTIVAAIRGVWGSLYNQKAFLTRDRFSIDESKLAMGVLVQASFKGELANGVLITEPISDMNGNSIAAIITGFPGEDLEVTNPPVGKIPETTRVSEQGIGFIVRSTEITPGRTLLNEAQYKELYKLATQVQKRYEAALGLKPNEVRLDMEWKLMNEAPNQRLVIKQVRPIPETASGSTARTVMMGGSKIRVCSASQESPEALSKLLLGQGGYLDLQGFSLGSESKPQIANPVGSFQMATPQGQLLNFTPWGPAKVQASEWRASGFLDGRETRHLDLMAPLKDEYGNFLSLSWSIDQYRKKSQLLSSLLALSISEVIVSGKVLGVDKNWRLRASINTDAECLGDLYNGYIPGFEGEEHLSLREPPHSANTTYQLKRSAVMMRARSSAQGYDKTVFHYLDEVQIRGLWKKDLVWRNPRATIHSPAHHNFDDEWSFDVASTEGLSQSERDELTLLGCRYLLMKSGYNSNGQKSVRLYSVDQQGKERLVDESIIAP